MITLQQAIELNSVVKVHAISGEFYEGVCTDDTQEVSKFNILTESQIITLPRWAVKRIWRHISK
ncbi:hypothetical protein [Saccharibacillus sacchari]|uniref:Uncharacterized protein n=1 Tax=Saccharibacillus sacchari TaxID=456493 RepID=A0ACC6PEH4_9BACL